MNVNPLQRVQRILPEFRSRSKIADEQSDGIPAKGVLEDARELRIAIWYSRLRMPSVCKSLHSTKKRTAPWFNACTTCPRTLRLLLIAALSAIRVGSFPVSLLFSEPARSTRLIFPVNARRMIYQLRREVGNSRLGLTFFCRRISHCYLQC